MRKCALYNLWAPTDAKNHRQYATSRRQPPSDASRVRDLPPAPRNSKSRRKFAGFHKCAGNSRDKFARSINAPEIRRKFACARITRETLPKPKSGEFSESQIRRIFEAHDFCGGPKKIEKNKIEILVR